MSVGYTWLKFVFWSYLNSLRIKSDVSGLANVPTGPKLIVGNHPNATDSFTLFFLFKEKLQFLVESDAMRMPIAGTFLNWAGMIPVVAGEGRRALEVAQRKLLYGDSVVIYPEAKLTGTHPVTHIGTGVARLAVSAQVPVLPLAFYVPQQYLKVLRGRTREGRPTVGTWQTRGRCYINIGAPIQVSIERAKSEGYTFFRKFTDEIMQTVSRLAEQAKEFAGSD